MTSLKKISITLSLILLGITITIIALIFSYQKVYAQKIYHGIYVTNFNLGGRTKSEAKQLLQEQTNVITAKGLTFVYKNKEITIDAINLSSDPNLTYEIFSYDIDKVIDSAYQIGRNSGWKSNLASQISLFRDSKNLVVNYNLNSTKLLESLKENLEKYNRPTKNSDLFVSKIGSNNYKVEITEEEEGQSFDYIKTLKSVHLNLSQLSSGPIKMVLKVAKPKITKQQAIPFIGDVQKAILKAPFELIYKDRSWQVNQDELASWLTLEKKSTDEIKLTFKQNNVRNFLEKIAKEIDLPAQEAKLKLEDGKVVEFQPSANGLELDIKKSSQTLETEFFEFTTKEEKKNIAEEKVIKEEKNTSETKEPLKIELTTNEIKPFSSVNETNDLGIKEIIGVGISHFKDSSSNRIHNIKTGASKLHGLLIEPGEEFSLAQALGKINGEAGYKTELVIKGSRVAYEYGGGLCQIATTIFRSAMGSGLPITERRPHAYNVAYYLENGVPGKDATIYAPHPDVRFINDTENYILIQTKIDVKKVEAIFEFWGTKDDRKATQTDIKTYDKKAAPATRYIETEDLKPGKKKCIDSAHAGITAEFDYIVEYPNGEVKTENFKSVYRPWAALCLVGKEPETEEKEAGEEEKMDKNRF